MSSLTPSSIAPPWGTWSLDAQFLADLNTWTAEHPAKNNLRTVLKAISNAIDRSEDWLECIPDSPFPAESLLAALAALLNFGVVSLVLLIFDPDTSKRVESRSSETRSPDVCPGGCGVDHPDCGRLSRR
jgi:hypothetical protein